MLSYEEFPDETFGHVLTLDYIDRMNYIFHGYSLTWFIEGLIPITDYVELDVALVTFCFRNKADAMLVKLTWVPNDDVSLHSGTSW